MPVVIPNFLDLVDAQKGNMLAGLVWANVDSERQRAAHPPQCDGHIGRSMQNDIVLHITGQRSQQHQRQVDLLQIQTSLVTMLRQSTDQFPILGQTNVHLSDQTNYSFAMSWNWGTWDLTKKNNGSKGDMGGYN